jgi:hypothetical protein
MIRRWLGFTQAVIVATGNMLFDSVLLQVPAVWSV